MKRLAIMKGVPIMKDDVGKTQAGDKPTGPRMRWETKVGTSVRQGWQSLQNGSNDMVRRIVSSYQRFAKSKHH